MKPFVLLGGVLALKALGVHAVDCNNGQPQLSDITDDLTSIVDDLCINNLTDLTDDAITYNSESLTFQISKLEGSDGFDGDCKSVLNEIISQCVVSLRVWGGSTVEGGAEFEITQKEDQGVNDNVNEDEDENDEDEEDLEDSSLEKRKGGPKKPKTKQPKTKTPKTKTKAANTKTKVPKTTLKTMTKTSKTKASKTSKVPTASATTKEKLVSGTGIFKTIKAPKSSWDKLKKICGAAGKKTTSSLNPRVLPAGFMGSEVGVGAFGKAPGFAPMGLYTDTLATCLGIVILGDAPPANANADTRWLLHLSLAGDWAGFEARVTAENLLNMRGWMSVPSPTTIGTIIHINGLAMTWTQADQTLSTATINTVKTSLNTLLGTDPKVKSRPMDPPSSMQIDGLTNVVSAAGGPDGFI